MAIHEYLMKAVQEDARRGERDRVFLEARRARIARRENAGLAAPVLGRLARLLLRRVTARPSVPLPSSAGVRARSAH
jgi:hypothetical protein